MRVNGEPVLACMEEARHKSTIEPLNLPVKKDLVTDLLPRLEQIASFLPKKDSVPLKKKDIDPISPSGTVSNASAAFQSALRWM